MPSSPSAVVLGGEGVECQAPHGLHVVMALVSEMVFYFLYHFVSLWN